MKKKTGPKPDGIKRARKSINLQVDIGVFCDILKEKTGWSYSECINHLCDFGLSYYIHNPLPEPEKNVAIPT